MSSINIFGKQFVKLDNNRIIPLILANQINERIMHSNETDAKVFWQPWCDKSLLGKTVEEIREDFEIKVNAELDMGIDREWVKTNGNTLPTSKVLFWFDNAVKYAKSIEEIYKKTSNSLICTLFRFNNNSKEEIMSQTCTTTKQIQEWLDAYIKYEKNSTDKVLPRMEFSTNKPLTFSDKNVIETPRNFVIRRVNDAAFLLQKINKKVTLTKNINTAKPFSSFKSAQQYIESHLKNFPSKYEVMKYSN